MLDLHFSLAHIYLPCLYLSRMLLLTKPHEDCRICSRKTLVSSLNLGESACFRESTHFPFPEKSVSHYVKKHSLWHKTVVDVCVSQMLVCRL